MVALNVMGVNLIAPVLPAYAVHFGVGFAVASSLLTAFAVARMSFRLMAGRLSDRHGSRVICAGGAVIQAGGAILAGFAPSMGVLLGARLIQGVGSAMFGTSVNRYLLVGTEKADLGRATAGFQAGILLGAALGPIVGGGVAERFGIFAPFYLQAGMATLLTLVSVRFVDDTSVGRSHTTQESNPIRSLLGLPGFKIVMFLGFGLFFVRAGATNVLVPAFADEVLAMSPALIGAVISLGSVVSLIAMPVAGHFADSVGRRPVAMTGAFGTAASVALFGLTHSTAGVAAVSALAGIGVGLASVALPTMVGDIAPSGTEGLASGVFRIANDLGWVFGPLVLGLLADAARFGWAFIAAAAPMLAGGVILALFRTG